MSDQQLAFALEPYTPARVHGPVTEQEYSTLRRRNRGILARVKAWFESHPGEAISAPALAEALGLRNENCVGPRLSELVADGWLLRSAERVPGPFGIGVHLYRRTEE